VHQSTLYLLYRRTKDQFDKLNSRYNRRLSRGSFSDLPGREKHRILAKLNKLQKRLNQLRFQLKVAVAAGTIVLSSAFYEAEAQTSSLGPFLELDEDSPFKTPIIQANIHLPSFVAY
jgi:hypothetical protein